MASPSDEKNASDLKPRKAFSDQIIRRRKMRNEFSPYQGMKAMKATSFDEIDWNDIKPMRKSMDLFSDLTAIPKCNRSTSGTSPVNRSPSAHHGYRDDTFQQYPMTKITDSVYLGSDNDATNEVRMREEGITHCLSMVARKFTKERRSMFNISSRSIKRKCVPMSDTGNSNVVKLLEEKELLAFMEESQKKKNKLLVHCQLGQNRSPTIVMAFLMKQQGLTFYRAWREVKQKRILVQPNKKYIKQLRDWDMYLNGKHSTPHDFLNLSVTGDEITLEHENVDTAQMDSVLATSVKKMRDSMLQYSSTEELNIQNTEDIDQLLSMPTKKCDGFIVSDIHEESELSPYLTLEENKTEVLSITDEGNSPLSKPTDLNINS